ncbi:MAG: YraN family protein [Saezia sp.]
MVWLWKSKSENVGAGAEEAAVRYLSSQGMALIARNFQPPGRGMADLDVIMQDRDGTIVFVEVRLRSSLAYGGAAGSITTAKQRRLIQAAQYFLNRFKVMPACRFDVVVFEGDKNLTPLWLKHAFEMKNN